MTKLQQHIGIAPLSVQEVYDTSSISTVSVHASAAPDDTDHVYDAPIDEAALVSKITWRLIPCIGWLYMLSFLDRVNLANVHGTILGDLKLSDTDYSDAVSIFFLGYCLFEIPSNLIMQRVQPRIWIARIMITWGAITCALAACSNRDELIVGRFFLGVAEAGFFPGMVFYLTSWFSPDELSSRIAMFFSTSAVAGVVGGLIAYGVLQMEGTFGLHGWQLLFLFEGIPSVLSGVACLWMLPNEPEGAAFLTRAEQRFATERLRRVHAQPQSTVGSEALTTIQPASKKEISWADMRRTLTDWRVWALSVLYLFVLITLYSLSFFLPAIIGQFGYSVLASNLLSVPIYFVAALVTVTVSYLSDRSKERFVHCAVPGALGCIFFAAMACVIDTDDRNLKFFLLMALVSVCWSLVPPLLSLLMSMLKGPTSSATGSAFCVSFGNLGGFVGPSICGWSKTAAQSYGPACVCFSACLFLFSAGMLALRYRLRNELPSGAGSRFSFDAVPVSEEDADQKSAMRIETASSASPSPSHSHEGPLYEPAPTPTAGAAPSHTELPPLPRALSSEEARDARLRPMRIRSFHELHASMGIAVVAAQMSSQLTPSAAATAVGGSAAAASSDDPKH